MIKYISLLFIALSFVACKPTKKVSQVVPKDEGPCCISTYSEFAYVPLIDLGKEYQRLKALKEDCCAKPKSPATLILNELEKQLGIAHTPKEKIIEVMGTPDVVQADKLSYYIKGKVNRLVFHLKQNKVDYTTRSIVISSK